MNRNVITVLLFSIAFGCNEIPENKPSCIIVKPENQVELPYFETIIIEVESWAEDGVIEKVDFYINDIYTSSADKRPFKYIWENPNIGEHRISATAFDSNGNSNSDQIEVIITDYGNVKDVEENSYRTVKIGDQIWMAENLKTSRYNDGKKITYGHDANQWSQFNPPSRLQCWYDNNEQYENPYGRLYNWYAVETEKLCPQGWSVPSYQDWEILLEHLEPKAGGKLKAIGFEYWKSPNVGATNETKFTALPAGLRHNDGEFEFINEAGIWWTSNSRNLGDAFRVFVNYNSDTLNNNFWSFKTTGLSVRCIKDQ
jgi:uncharacterized protein (TIGR02145 family)